MLCSCRVSCFCRLQSSYRCCRSSRRLRRLINGRRHAGTATASCRVIISHRITAFQTTPRKLRFRAWRATTGALGISTQSQVITGMMATGTISAGPAFTAVATMAAASALAGRGRRSGRSGIAADQVIAWRPRTCIRLPATAAHGAKRSLAETFMSALCTITDHHWGPIPPRLSPNDGCRQSVSRMAALACVHASLVMHSAR